MAHQFGSLNTSLSSTFANKLVQQASRASVKRRNDDDSDYDYQPSNASMSSAKRHFDLSTQFSPDVPKQEPLPAITYASPDYRPPPPTETPLWLQPMPSTANSPMTEDDYFEDDNALLTPSLQKLQQQQEQEKSYWGDMMIDQWQQ